MKRETVMQVLQMVGAVRKDLAEVGRIVDAEALPVGDRNVIEHALSNMTSELHVLSQTLSDLLSDPTKVE